jgi:O-antigen/teichoic acid export membrane protein
MVSDAALSTLGAVGGTLISGISSIVIARGLGVTGRGRWAVISSLAILVATVCATGLPVAAAYAAARLRAAEREQLAQAALACAAVFALLAALAYLACAAVVRPPASSAAVLAGCAIPAATIAYGVAHQLTLTLSSMRWFAASQLLSATVTLAAVVALGLTGALTVLAVVIVSAGGCLVGLAVSLTSLRRGAALGRTWLVSTPAIAMRILRPYVAYAGMSFATLSLATVVERVDVLLVNAYKGPHAAGLYAVAAQLTSLMLVVPAALGLVVFRRAARSSPDHYSEATRVLRWSGAFAVAAGVVALLSAAWIVPFVLGSGYRGSVEPLRLLLPGMIAFSLQSVLSNYLAGRGRPRSVLVAWLVGMVAGIGGDLVVIPRYGIAGAAVVSSLSYLLVTGLHFRALRALRPAPPVAA